MSKASTRCSLAFLGVLLACSDDTTSATDGGADPNLIRAAEGGLVNGPGGSTLDIPPGALSEDTVITMSGATGLPSDPAVITQTAVDLKPDGLVFSQAATLTLRYNAGDVPSEADASTLRVHKLVGSTWEEVSPSSVDTSQRQVTAALMGFSTYAARASSTSSPDAGVTDGGAMLDSGAMLDAGTPDAGEMMTDASVQTDAGAQDAGPGDAGAQDAAPDAGPGDAGSGDAGGGSCNALVNDAPVHLEQAIDMMAPTLNGGTILPGRYHRTQTIFWGQLGGGEVPDYIKETSVITQTSAGVFEVQGVTATSPTNPPSPETRTTSVYTVSGASGTTVLTCGGTGSFVVPFEMSGNTLTLQVGPFHFISERQ